MKFNRFLFALFLLSAVLLSGALYHSWKAGNVINCREDFSIVSSDSAGFSGTADFAFRGKNGDLKLLGRVGGQDGATISRTIFFSYSKKGDTYLLKSEQIVKSSGDTADDATVKKFFPAAYTTENQFASRQFTLYRGGFLLSIVGLPVAYCKLMD